MGRTYLFECPRCGYRARVSGSDDHGFHFAVQTIECLECKDLYDAVTRLKLTRPNGGNLLKGSLQIRANRTASPPPTFPAVLNRLPLAEPKPLVWVNYAPACPVSARHRVRAWKQPGRCPKCGIFLESSAIPFRLWD
jgi:hypothetical protein